MSYKADTIGNVSIKVDNQTANAFTTNVKIEGNGNDVQLIGHILPVKAGWHSNLTSTILIFPL
jgi:hypothetical protein